MRHLTQPCLRTRWGAELTDANINPKDIYSRKARRYWFRGLRGPYRTYSSCRWRSSWRICPWLRHSRRRTRAHSKHSPECRTETPLPATQTPTLLLGSSRWGTNSPPLLRRSHHARPRRSLRSRSWGHVGDADVPTVRRGTKRPVGVAGFASAAVEFAVDIAAVAENCGGEDFRASMRFVGLASEGEIRLLVAKKPHLEKVLTGC